MIKLTRFSVLFALGIFSSCGGVPQTHYYRIDNSPGTVVSNDQASVPVALGIAQFTSDILYESDKIVYRHSAYEAQFYHYRRWVAAPRKIVTEKILKQYQSSRAFKKVVRLPAKQPIDYVLKGNIQAFEEWDEGNTWSGLVTLEFTLQDVTTNAIVWDEVLSEKTRAVKKDPVEVVKAINQSLDKVVQSSISQIREYLTNPGN